MLIGLEFAKTVINAITAKFRRIQSNVDAVKSNVDAVKSDVEAVKQSAPDWDEPNSTSPAYIKNKPCYDYIEPRGVIWESDSAGTSGQGSLVLADLVDGRLIEGETYSLTVDGVTTTYTCVAREDGLYIAYIFQSYTVTTLRAYTDGLWNAGQKVRLEGPLRRYKKLDTSLYDSVVSINGETGEVQITPENIGAANVGSTFIKDDTASYLIGSIHGTYNGGTCSALYLGGNRWLKRDTLTDTGEAVFTFAPKTTILAGIKTPTNDNQAANKGYVDATVAAPRDSIILHSSTDGSAKLFEITVSDDGVVSVTEVVE